jgi:hypothetical protein
MEAAPASGAAETDQPTRVTALPLSWISPRLVAGTGPGHAPDDPAVRRFWTALIGPGAVADLLRLTAAARTGRSLRRPVHLSLLLHEGLVRRDGEQVLVFRDVPMMAPHHLRRLRPALRAEYRRVVGHR